MFYDFYVGSYAPADHESIYKYQLNGENGSLVRKEAVKGVDNPSWLLIHPNGKFMYSVEELNPDGRIAVYSLESGTPEYLFSLEAEGADPCHLSLSQNGRFLFAANYSGGSLAVFRLDASGRPEGMSDYRQHAGKGTNPDRQEGPHVHFTRMIGGKLYVCDLGLDRIVVYDLDEESGRLIKGENDMEPGRPTKSGSDIQSDKPTERGIDIQPGGPESGSDICFPGGYGPRHLAVHDAHKDFMYVIGELTGDVCVLRNTGDRYEIIQRVSSLPENHVRADNAGGNAADEIIAGEDVAGESIIEEHVAAERNDKENTAAAIKFSEDGKLLFVSNRGADTITSFLVRRDGGIEKADCVSCGGSGPRDFAIFGECMVVANQHSDNLALIRFREESGQMELLPVSEPVAKPVVIVGAI